MARILLLTPQLPYPTHQGTTLRNFNIIRGLAERHNLALLSYVAPESNEMSDSLRILRQYCDSITTAEVGTRSNLNRFIDMTTSKQPDMALRLQSNQIDGKLQESLTSGSRGNGQGFEIVQIEGIEMANVIPMVKEASPASKIVFDNHNAEYELQRRTYEADLKSIRRWPLAAYSFIQANRLKSYEKWACESVDHVVAVSEADKQGMLKIAPGAKITVIPNSVDVSDYSREDNAGAFEYDLVFIGKMDYRPNVDAVLWFAESIWPKVVEQRPQSTWAIVGQNPHPRLEKLRGHPGIELTGKVEKIQPYLIGGTICIMPLRFGSGTRLKLIEAMAAGKAIISTSIGAEGFDLTDQEELIIANDANEFLDAIVRLLEDKDLRRQIGERARRFAKKYDFRRVVPMFDTVYEAILTRKPEL